MTTIEAVVIVKRQEKSGCDAIEVFISCPFIIEPNVVYKFKKQTAAFKMYHG